MIALARWFRPPRHVLALFLGVTGSLFLAMGWLAWELVVRDTALAAQRTQERLDNAADASVATLRNGLGDLSQQLEVLSRFPAATAAGEFAQQASLLGDDAVLILADEESFDALPRGRLVYVPVSTPGREAADPASQAFARGELLEFGHRDLAGALRAFEPLTAAEDPRLRAGALLRVARVRSQLHQHDRALDVYDRLAALEAIPAEGLPAGLLGRYGRCLMLRDLGRQAELGREAAVLDLALARGTWRLSRGEYEFYRSKTRGWMPPAADAPPADASGERLSAAVAAVWDAWGESPAPPRGGRVERTSGGDVLVCWHRTGARTAALAAGPLFVARRLVGPANAGLARYRASMALLVEKGPANGRLPRAPADTGLPWLVHIDDQDPGAELEAAASRRRVVLAGLVALGVFVLAGSAFIVRAVNRELEVSRLQADFVAAVSHEFRTPLTSIRQVSELLLEGRVPEGRREDYYRMQHRDSERLQRLVESLLDFRRMESGAREYLMEPADVTTVVREVAGEFSAEAAAAGYSVETDLRSEGALVSGDREALARAVWNLLDNAVKYSPSHKVVWLSSAVVDGRVEISVRDRGVGVAPEDRRRIFDKFARGAGAAATGAKGTGLGLAMVQHIVSAHCGTVRVEGAPGEGSTFTIALPILGGAATGGPDASNPDRRG